MATHHQGNATSSSNTSGRLEGLDLARFFAFLGMVIVNFGVAMAVPETEAFASRLSSILQGKAAAVFVVLAGVGLGFAAKGEPYAKLATFLKRALFLFVIGVLNMLVFQPDILHFYALYFLFGALLLPLSSRALFGCIIFLSISFLLFTLVGNYDANWDWETLNYQNLWSVSGFLLNLFLNGWHPAVPWLGFLLFGIIVSRWQLGKTKTQIKMVIAGVVLIAASLALSIILEPSLTRLHPELGIFATTAPIPPMPLYLSIGIGSALVTIGVCLLIAKPLERVGITQFVAPAGRQTLTLYVAHILVGMGTLEALGMLQGESAAMSLVCALGFCGASLLYAYGWSRKFKLGPLEALMRRLTA